jgi:hypothetical protein
MEDLKGMRSWNHRMPTALASYPRRAGISENTRREQVARRSSVKDFERPAPMKTGPSLPSIALLLALAACSKQPQDAAPSSTPTPASALGTPASDSSLPSASAS